MPFHLAWLCKKGQYVKIFFWFLTHLSGIFPPYIKNLETYFAILICFEFWPMWINNNVLFPNNSYRDFKTFLIIEIWVYLQKLLEISEVDTNLNTGSITLFRIYKWNPFSQAYLAGELFLEIVESSLFRRSFSPGLTV